MNDTRASGASAVYVQTNTSPNEVIAFRRSDDGSLDRIGNVPTGGDGSGSPHLQSQGSVALTRDGQHLLVTNAGTTTSASFQLPAMVRLSFATAWIAAPPPEASPSATVSWS
jgi:hypothetical protein